MVFGFLFRHFSLLFWYNEEKCCKIIETSTAKCLGLRKLSMLCYDGGGGGDGCGGGSVVSLA